MTRSRGATPADRSADVRARLGGQIASLPADRAAEVRALLGGEIVLPAAVRATIEAWRGGAPFGLALAGDAHRAETLFRQLRPHADGVVRLAHAYESPTRVDRVLALCADTATLPAAARRRCTAVVDVDAIVPPGRRPAHESEAGLWRRVVAALAAHGVDDGAIDVAACALASALVDAGYDGDPVAVVRAWVAVPHGRGLAASGAGEVDPPNVEETSLEPDADDGDASVADDADGEQAIEEPATGEAASDAVDDGAESLGAPGSDDDPAGETVAEPTGDGAGDAPEAPLAPEPGDPAGADPEADAAAASSLPAHDASAPGGHRRPDSAPDDVDPSAASDTGIAVDGEPDALPSARAAALAAPVLTDQPARATVRSGRSARRGATRAGGGRGRPGRVVAPERADGRVALLPTLQRAVYRHAAAGGRGELVVTRDDLRGRLRAQPTATHTVVVVDGSSSMGSAGAAHARRVADVALAHAYRDRGDVSVILAAGAFARLVQERTPRVSRARAALQRASAEGGGGTPLADAVRRALEEFADAPRERCRLVIVSDGQPTVDLAGRADPRAAARDLRTQLDRAAARAGRCVFVPLDPRGWSPLERTLAPFRTAGVEVVAG
ncbi:Mg-chelatase subunit ChlD [Microbacterium sp. SORGH_AS 1204]|uniref:VWA domain-containing protein n=1 Tax=Microbacterium sp. SORGH_AS_1204 TaxID=3041785 RepID=UPI002793ED16|nr:VWA domain-containing protein [Microbacterium sp. SORGH_AS_1204]MDQ1137384.1 Mg-chelatase subunit ChlD [Microbacterium sp. SORGH_AS_1204]